MRDVHRGQPPPSLPAAGRRGGARLTAVAIVAAVAIDLPSGLAPRGPAGDALVSLWWAMFWLAAAIFIGVCVLLAVSLVRRRDRPLEGDGLAGERYLGGGNLLILGGGVVLPVIVVLVLTVLMVTTGRDVRALAGDADPLVVEVTGHQFWWDVRLPESGVRTANEIPMPVGRTIEVHVTSADVIHSFWVPQLGPKIDLTPGERNVLRLQADEPGVYRGMCTEFCGIQHALMHVIVVAMPADEFDAWVAARVEPPAPPTDALVEQGQGVFQTAQCAVCHTVSGVSPDTDLGPDLTHFGGRLTLGAGARPNERSHLVEWIRDPHTVKQGNHMPASRLSDDDLRALVAYLESLE